MYTIVSPVAFAAQLHRETVLVRSLAERSVKHVMHFNSNGRAAYQAFVTAL